MSGKNHKVPRRTRKAGLWFVIGVMAVLLSLSQPSFAGSVPLNQENKEIKHKKSVPPKKGSWRFIVSGDSRNCGDVVVPAIAADSKKRYHPSFYWHLGDLRAIYKIDEDMAGAAEKSGTALNCQSYLERAWPDMIEHQLGGFGRTQVYVGIGNHEEVPPKNDPPGQFTEQFKSWLLAPAIKEQRIKDQDCDRAAGEAAGSAECVILPRNYYHWIQGGVDFIYLDNARNVFGEEQISWLKKTLANARANKAVRSLVVGMHEALPQSLSADHAMCDTNHQPGKAPPNDTYPYQKSCNDGEEVYNQLVDFQNAEPKKKVYVLASHSHFYMKGIFNINDWPESRRLQGWIVGTAGAVRYSIPKDPRGKPEVAQTNVYGYLLGTVDGEGNIDFKFKQVKQSDVPGRVRKQYPEKLVSWCFAHNSMDLDPHAADTTPNCLAPAAAPSPTLSPGK